MITSYPWFFDLLAWIIPILTAVTWRETVKAWASHFRGDSTAKMLGYASWNPVKHINPIGSLLIPLVLVMRHTFVYGWGNPVDIRPGFLRKKNLDVAIIIICALLSNIAMACAWVPIYKLGQLMAPQSPQLAEMFILSARAGIHINLLLFILHALPLPPLDCSLIVREFMPRYIRAIYTWPDGIGHYVIAAALLIGAAQPFLNMIYIPLNTFFYSYFGLAL